MVIDAHFVPALLYLQIGLVLPTCVLRASGGFPRPQPVCCQQRQQQRGQRRRRRRAVIRHGAQRRPEPHVSVRPHMGESADYLFFPVTYSLPIRHEAAIVCNPISYLL